MKKSVCNFYAMSRYLARLMLVLMLLSGIGAGMARVSFAKASRLE